MQRSEPLRDMLVSMTGTYNDGEKVNVQFATGPSAALDGSHVNVTADVNDWLGVDLNGPQELRMIMDALSHEVEHVRESDLKVKQRLNEKYTSKHSARHGKLAGEVANIVEDQYVDWNRTERFRGLKRVHAFFVENQLRDDDAVVPLDKAGVPKGKALLSGLFQIGLAGYARGISNVDDDEVREFLAWASTQIEQARYCHDAETREAIACRISERLFEHVDVDDIPYDIGESLPTESTQTSVDPGQAPDDDDIEAVADELDSSGDDESGDDESAEPEQDDDAQGQDDGDGDGDDSEQDESDDESGSGSGGSNETDESDDDEQGQGSGSGDAESESDDPVQDALDDMDERDAADDAGRDWLDVDERAQVDDTEADRQKFENIQQDIREEKTDIGAAKRERDEKIEKSTRYDSNDVRQYMRETGMARDVRRAFEKLASQDDDHAAVDGGRVNVQNAVRHMAGDYSERELMIDEHVAAHGGRLVGVSLDCSSSMGSFMKEAKAALASIRLATHEIGDTFCANGFGTNYDDNTRLVTAPGESFEYEHLDAVGTAGSTPTASGMQELRTIMKAHPAREKLMLVVCDGKANRSLKDLSFSATSDARSVAQQARKDGIGVIGVGIGSINEGKMQQMFGEDGYFMADSDNLADELVSKYEDQMDVERVE